MKRALEEAPTLFSYWRSSSSWRIRTVLEWKNINYNYHAVNLLKSEHLDDAYMNKYNPMREVPTLLIDGHTLCQSVAICDYLEETRPEKPLLPKDPYLRAKVRQIVETINADIQPVQSLRVLNKHSDEQAKKTEWAQWVINWGFQALEKILAETSGTHCIGDTVTLADVYLVPQVYNANRFNVDMKLYPIISRLNESALKLDAFKRAHPNEQPDCPPDQKK